MCLSVQSQSCTIDVPERSDQAPGELLALAQRLHVAHGGSIPRDGEPSSELTSLTFVQFVCVHMCWACNSWPVLAISWSRAKYSQEHWLVGNRCEHLNPHLDPVADVSTQPMAASSLSQRPGTQLYS